MHAHLEQSVTTRSDCPVQSLSWMGKVPDAVPDEDGWKLNRASYYQEGWLATGNSGGIVGVTFTAGHTKRSNEGPPRTNFNLRGHRSEVVLVKWNEPYQKLATCDATGVIFVWIKHEGRWSIELINDRSSQVTDFTWSHDGRMALICYRDGFVLVGSVAGQRYWSSMLNLDSCLITTGTWSHDDQKVLFGTSDGQMIVMNSNGAMLTQVAIQETVEISAMAWACEKFYLNEQDGSGRTSSAHSDSNKPPLLAVTFRTGAIYLMSNYDDICPKIIHTGLTGLRMEWSNDGEVLAVAGFIRLPNLECRNEIRFYSRQAVLKYRLHIPHQGKPVSHLTWGHNDRRLFVAVGCHVFTIWVTKMVASLQFLCKRQIQKNVKDEGSILKLPLPIKIQNSIQLMYCPTIRGYIPQPHKLREFVCIPPTPTERLHCTMIRQGDECSGGHYTLYLEYLGGLIPLLKGKRASKIRPEFIIFDPKIKAGVNNRDDDSVFISSDSSVTDSESEGDVTVEGCGSPRMQRRKKTRKLKDRYERRDSVGFACSRPIDELMYDDNLPEAQKLVEITSNIWGTKFKLHSLASFLPEDLGQVLYKTSLLHLQPRQMTITIVEISDDLKPQERDPGYNPNHFSESEDEVIQVDGEKSSETTSRGTGFHDNLVAISPETPACPHPIPALATLERRPDPPHGLPGGKSNKDCSPALHQSPPNTTRPSPQALFVDKPEHLAPLEIRSLDGSPPQRRSPSFKPRALSPAEQIPFVSNTLVNGPSDGYHPITFLTDVYKTSISSKHKCENGLKGVAQTHNKKLNANEQCPTNARTEAVRPPSTLSVVQMAANKLESDKVLNSESNEVHNPSPDGSSSSVSELSNQTERLPRWADKACHEIKFIDEDSDDTKEVSSGQADTVYCNMGELSAREIMSSMQMLHQLEQANESCSVSTGCGDLGTVGTTSIVTQIQSLTAFEPQKKRVVLSRPPESKQTKPRSKLKDLSISSLRTNTRCLEMTRGDRCKPRNGILENSRSRSTSPTPSRRPLQANSTIQQVQKESRRGSFDLCLANSQQDQPSNQSASLPTSPVHKVLPNKKSKSKNLCHRSRLQSPLSGRRQKYSRAVDSSDEEVVLSGDEVTTSENYRNLETFQKAQLTRKLRRARTKSDADSDRRTSPFSSPKTSPHNSPSAVRKRHFVMHNKAPMWNENSQVYQLDFGGRVTQESAKNFQIEFRGKQVMQFGRIDSNAYTLDFQYPFSAIQAFAVALANVTQRLK